MMNRREFLQRLGLITASGIILPYVPKRIYVDMGKNLKPDPLDIFGQRMNWDERSSLVNKHLYQFMSDTGKQLVFEHNDAITQARFRMAVGEQLRLLQARRAIFDYAVVCDATNNTPDVIDRHRFVGDVFIKKGHTINTTHLRMIISPGVVGVSHKEDCFA
jgi:hypothetical protein